GRRADPTASADWLPYADAIARLNPSYSGLGFVFTKSLNITGIDLDDAIDENGNLKPWAREIMKRFASTYSEISPSGKGIKLFPGGHLSGAGLKVFVSATGDAVHKDHPDRAGAVEMYDT